MMFYFINIKVHMVPCKVEFNNLWDDPNHERIKADLVEKSFHAHVLLTTDVGSRRIAPM